MQLQMTSFYNEFKDREFLDRTIVTSTSTLTRIIPRPISKINDITLKHIYKMITDDLRIELTKETKRIVNTCIKLFHLFRILEQTLPSHCSLKRIKTGCVSIISLDSETTESILSDVTETGHQLQGLTSSEEGVRNENTLNFSQYNS
ncbi:hypothetical protein PHYBLDRAFT_68744 [Phycomyces blakesleeanus NRRL 1555(-)]|uniref:Uncharacterized protein n=1 Tax=Phycomyces blakesleeanus (strain ATCC 8743b / DSM 1359 / FGSC 10004 / NBRC 33097 / NRRL 1555) TaxID=763407 RepID=A0A162TYA1_PHYB8|nr:hypothetical protein PHYBLDRAFT_68744 [Phycomyces blakesleeanus NRRL 1555(-)]OAD71972.1 hypothetical protein PHYBLDRAFT_68744 [Phycomyces blakesleeanus NRRL 1555(-)]|eukprot:XP_018290012.1 hypothetical protein PHYBLDRAFT_68744 [Phycomyces blakesleeanus NRRL 1555(-)]